MWQIQIWIPGWRRDRAFLWPVDLSGGNLGGLRRVRQSYWLHERWKPGGVPDERTERESFTGWCAEHYQEVRARRKRSVLYLKSKPAALFELFVVFCTYIFFCYYVSPFKYQYVVMFLSFLWVLIFKNDHLESITQTLPLIWDLKHSRCHFPDIISFEQKS